MVEGASPITAPEGTNVLQNFSDATAGRSLQLFWPVATTDSVGIDYVLVRDSGVSLPTTTNAGGTTTLDFDITINKPTIIAGIATIDCKYEYTSPNSSGSCYIIFTIYHYDGSTETSLGSVTTATITDATKNTPRTPKLQFQVTKKLFGIGHILRLKATLTTITQDSTTLWHDPNTAGDELKLWLPIVNLE